MFMTFSELERRAYINGRTYLAKAYAAADDNANVNSEAREAFNEIDLEKMPIGALFTHIEKAQESIAGQDDVQLGLEI